MTECHIGKTTVHDIKKQKNLLYTFHVDSNSKKVWKSELKQAQQKCDEVDFYVHFHRLNTKFQTVVDDRYQFFIDKILPQFKSPLMAQTLIFIPSYFDFVRVRNYFTAEEMNFVQISENSSDRGITRARYNFYHRKAHFMLYTERLHFNRRFKIRGAKHLILYELPHFPHFYSELCNMLGDHRSGSSADVLSCTVIYSRFEAPLLVEVVGTQRAQSLLSAPSSHQCLVTGET